MRSRLVMTAKQKEYAAENHNLVYSYLNRKCLSADDYYDIVIPGYLRAVINYDERVYLRRYRFATIAWKSMNTNLWNYRMYMNRKKRKADVLSLDYNLPAGNGLSLLDTVAPNSDPAKDYEDKLFWLEVYSLLNESQIKLIQMRLTGYSKLDIARRLEIPSAAIEAGLLSAWYSVKGLYKEIPSTVNNLERKGA